ncbi:MAG: beta strand repeat-containing protein, partial [Candidatus Spyradenecus sp.]
KGIWGKGTTNCALNLSGGTLSIGSDGFKSIDRLTVTATGGELNAFASNTIAQAIALNGPTTFSANADCEMTVQGALSGSGALTIGTETATGTVVLGTQRPTIGGIATTGAKLKLTATESELANCAITLPTTLTTAPAKERFTVLGPGGTPLTLTAEPTVTDGTLTVTLPQTGGVITATGNWSTAGVSEETVVYVRGGESAESAITVTLDANLSDYTQIVVIGHVKFVTTTTQATLPTAIVLERGSVLTATASFSGAYTIPSGATVVLDGTTTAISSGNALTVNGTLKTQGTVTLSGANAVPAGGSLTVETGTLTLTASDQSLAGTINIAAGATLVNVTGDALAYGGTPVVNVRGTLDMRSTRWTVGSTNTLNVYAGATIQGAGDTHGALDFYNEATHTLNVPNEGDASQPVTISAKLRLRQANVLLKFNIALANAKVNLTGIVRDVGKLEKAGAGSSRLILSGENKTYTGATTVTVGYLDLVGGCTLATSGVTVASGAAVTFQADDATTETTYTTPFTLTGRMDKEGAHSVILSGAITGAGAVNVTNGGLTLDASAATAEAPRTVDNPITVGLDSGTSGTLTAKGFLSLSNTSNTVKTTGTLTIASGKTVLSTTGSGGGIKGNLTIASGATLQCGTGDAPLYNGTQTFDISGTLEITGSTRWTISSGATITLREGARLKGAGDSSCAFDFWKGGTITADGDATIEASVGNHNSDGKTLTITQSAGTTTISGEVRNSLGLSVAGSGTVVYAPAKSVTATSSPLSVSSGATLQLSPGSAFALNGAVSGAGKLVLGNGSAATNFTSTKAYPDAAQSLTVQVKSPSKLTLNPGAGNFAFPNAVAFDVASGAELILASGMSFFGVSGEGSCSVTGNYVFGVSGTAASDGFPDAAKVLDVATLTVGTPTNTAVTLGIRPFGAIDIAPTTLKVNKNAVIARDSNTNATATASVSIGATATVTGEGTIGLPVAFTEGATLDTVTAAPLLLKGKVTGTIKVKLDTAKAVLTTTSDAEFDRNTQLAFASDTTSQQFAGYRFAETVFGTTHTFTVVPPLELPGSLPEAVSGNVAAQDAIYDAVAAMKGFGYDITSVTAVTAQSTGGVAGNVEALALFENLYAQATYGDKLTENTYEGTVTVYYDFGISEMRVKSASLGGTGDPQLYVLLCAKVATTQGTSTANYATGTIVTLYKGDTPVNTALTPTNEQLATLGITPAAGEEWFAVPMAELDTGTNAFTVRASQTTPTP